MRCTVVGLSNQDDEEKILSLHWTMIGWFDPMFWYPLWIYGNHKSGFWETSRGSVFGSQFLILQESLSNQDH
jgi:hypothetical protein